MKKYQLAFSMTLRRVFEYRFNFFIGRFTGIFILLVFYYLWKTLAVSGRFAGYGERELLTYVFAAHILRALVFGNRSQTAIGEINQGIFSKYLVMPVNYFWFNFFRDLALRFLNTACALFEIAVFWLIVRPDLIWPQPQVLLVLAVVVAGAIFLHFAFNYLINLMAFWSREVMGPKFVFEWIIEFFSGVLFPIGFLAASLGALPYFLPFGFLVYYPVELYLGRIPAERIFYVAAGTWIWAAAFIVLAVVVWKRGLKKYSGEGI